MRGDIEGVLTNLRCCKCRSGHGWHIGTWSKDCIGDEAGAPSGCHDSTGYRADSNVWVK